MLLAIPRWLGATRSPRLTSPLAGKRLDLALPECRLDIEVDGERHHRDEFGGRKAEDLWRDLAVKAAGWTPLRFWVRASGRYAPVRGESAAGLRGAGALPVYSMGDVGERCRWNGWQCGHDEHGKCGGRERQAEAGQDSSAAAPPYAFTNAPRRFTKRVRLSLAAFLCMAWSFLRRELAAPGHVHYPAAQPRSHSRLNPTP